MPTYYIKNGAQKPFDPGYTRDELMLVQAKGVRVFAFRRSNDRPMELLAGSRIPVMDIYEDYLLMLPQKDGVGEFTLRNLDAAGNLLAEDQYIAASFPVILDCDSDRDGIVGTNEPGKANWTWGPEGRGAILIVNNDKDRSDVAPLPGQYSEFGELIVRSTGYDTLPHGFELRIYATPEAARRFAVYRMQEDNKVTKVLGRRLTEGDADTLNIAEPLKPAGERLFVEAHEYPGPFFEGLITIKLQLVQKITGLVVGPQLANDRVVFRVAPWIMMPNNLPVEQVYTTQVVYGPTNNAQFLKGLQKVCDELEVPLHVIPPMEHYGDRWIQDEVEIGYSRGAQHFIHVVFDSPRDRGLDDFPERKLLGPDFGHFQKGGSTPNSLDSFGNLEVSPPVTVGGQTYPLGRIIFGGRAYVDFGDDSRQMMPEVRKFLYAQKVQSPIEVFTDWLTVGHVDEILCFVPDSSPKGFKALLASPRAAFKLLHEWRADGHGDTIMFKGMKRGDGTSAEITIEDLLADRDFRDGNGVFQEFMNLNQAIIEKHLGLDRGDIIEIPVLFQVDRDPTGKLQRTLAYFPDMINHLVIGDVSIIPKPYGPKIDGECGFERAMRDALDWRDVRFIDDWYSYHEMSGEVHCGTNVRRTPPKDVKWWESKSEGAFDI